MSASAADRAHVAVRPVARQRELRGSTGFIVRVHRSFTDAYWPFTDSEYCPFVGGGLDLG